VTCEWLRPCFSAPDRIVLQIATLTRGRFLDCNAVRRWHGCGPIVLGRCRTGYPLFVTTGYGQGNGSRGDIELFGTGGLSELVAEDVSAALCATKQQVPAGEHRELIRQTLARVNELVSEETPEGMETDTLALLGVVYEKVLAAARELRASLVVIAAGSDSSAGIQDLGPNATRVARHASCPVLLVRDGNI
jgi:nucleotide-binding universal stress UspA family protein